MKKKKCLKIIGIVLALLLVWLIWDNVRIAVTHYSVSDSNLPDAFDGYTIVQVSDLHNASFGKNQSRLIKKIKQASPDLIAITGDLIDSSRIDAAMQFIEQAVSIAPCYYIMGNHEAWNAAYEKELRPKLLENGVTILDNSETKIYKDNQTITIAGLQDPDAADAKDAYTWTDTKLSQIECNGYTILLSHRPELFPVYTRHPVNLVLSGHAHGGQVRIPFVGGLISPGEGLFPRYTEGSFQADGTEMIVSRGLGNSVIPVRVNDCPELVVVTLEKTA